MELTESDIRELIELVGEKRIGALRIVAENAELVLGVDAAALSELLHPTQVAQEYSGVLTRRADASPESGGTAERATSEGGDPPDAASDKGWLDPHTGGAAAPGRQAEDRTVGETVTSPLVGVFYNVPEPGAAPYVSVGDRVEATTTVGLVEAMKVFTAVQAGNAGTITRIVVGNEEFVEFGQTLMELDRL